MERDTDTDEARQRALHLAAEVAETDDNNVPVLLLGLKEILESCPSDSELGTLIRIDLWTYDIIHVSKLALKQDFSLIRGQWSTAASLSVLLCQCCVGLELPEVPEYRETFLPDVVENVLTITANLHDAYNKSQLVTFTPSNTTVKLLVRLERHKTRFKTALKYFSAHELYVSHNRRYSKAVYAIVSLTRAQTRLFFCVVKSYPMI